MPEYLHFTLKISSVVRHEINDDDDDDDDDDDKTKYVIQLNMAKDSALA